MEGNEVTAEDKEKDLQYFKGKVSSYIWTANVKAESNANHFGEVYRLDALE